MHCLNVHGPRFSALSQPAHLHGLWSWAGDAAIFALLDDRD